MAKKFASDKPTMAEIRKLRKPNRRSVSILLDPDYKVQILALQREIAAEERKDKRQNRNPLAPGLKKKLEALEEEAHELEVEYVFESVGNKRYSELLDEHPPTPEQIEEHGEIQYDPETFPQALVLESCVEPALTEEDVNWMWDEFSTGDVTALWQTALLVNVERASVPFTKTGIEDPLSSLSNLTSVLEEDLLSPTAGT